MENVQAIIGEDFTIKTDKKLPNAALTFAVILVPVFLICANSFANMVLPKESTILPYLGFIGHPIPALSVGVILALFLDTSLFSKDQVYTWFDRAVESSGFIILATGAAGAFGAVLKASGVGTYLGNLIASSPLPAVFVPFLVALLLSVSNGSATGSLLTGTPIMLPLLPSLESIRYRYSGNCSRLLLLLSCKCSHFWVVVKSNDLSMKRLCMVSVASALGSLAAIIAVWIMSFFLTV
jgi:GntP family gluconate:H+ symporter